MEGIIFIVVLRVHFLVGDPPTLVFLFFLLHHWFVATTAVTRPMRVEKGQKAPSSSGRTADSDASDASDDGEKSSSASKFLQIVLENSCTTFTLCVIVLQLRLFLLVLEVVGREEKQ